MRLQAGETYVLFGSRGLTSGTIRDAAGTAGMAPDIIIYGAVSGDEFGVHLATGDLNGDGLTDIIGTAPFGGIGTFRASLGTAYVMLGRIS